MERPGHSPLVRTTQRVLRLRLKSKPVRMRSIETDVIPGASSSCVLSASLTSEKIFHVFPLVWNN